MINSEYCKSCGACEAVCPVGALLLVEKRNGFKTPVIDSKECINCGLCHRACALTRAIIGDLDSKQEIFAARSNNVTFCSTSRSGGVFRTLAEYIVKHDYAVIYAAAQNGAIMEYERTEHSQNLFRFAGSKYVWIDHTYYLKKIGEDLNNGRIVLFSGLPCQVASVLAYLKIKRISCKNLLTCDIICHGCPSPRLFQDYLTYQESRYKDKIAAIDFRNKKIYGWKAHIETLYMNQKRIHSDIWAKIFYSHYGFRNSCFYCEYKDIKRVGDFTLGDCWNIEKTSSVLNDDNGTSLLFVNSKKGKQYLSGLKCDIYMERIDLRDFMQPALEKSVEKPSNYEAFWKAYEERGFTYILKNFIGYTFKRKFWFYIKHIYYRVTRLIKRG